MLSSTLPFICQLPTTHCPPFSSKDSYFEDIPWPTPSPLLGSCWLPGSIWALEHPCPRLVCNSTLSEMWPPTVNPPILWISLVVLYGKKKLPKEMVKELEPGSNKLSVMQEHFSSETDYVPSLNVMSGVFFCKTFCITVKTEREICEMWKLSCCDIKNICV